MKNLISTLLSVIFLFLLVSGIQAQDKPIKKVNPKINNTKQLNNAKINKNSTINKNLTIKNNQIPEFRIIRPTSISPSASARINTNQLRKADLIPTTNFNFTTSPINTTLTPRKPFHSGRAYVEFLSGYVKPATNEVECACGIPSKASYVYLLLRADAGKRYMVTLDVSPVRQNFELELFSSDYVHQAVIDSENQKVDIILSTENPGTIGLWMQCSDTDIAGKKWTFHSAQIQEIE